jgi:DNA polymerase
MTRRALQQHLEVLYLSGIRELYTSGKAGLGAEPVQDKGALLASLAERYGGCTKCQLHRGRIKFVYGEGNPDATAMLIGEGPGDQENRTGRPFVGRAGELLDNMLRAIELSRGDVYIANIVKCRPPGNRDPETQEREACLPYLLEQISVIQPKLFLFLGRVAAQTLLQTRETMEQMRSRTHLFQGVKTYVTYHPAALLRNEHWKRPAWEDLKRFIADYREIVEA